MNRSLLRAIVALGLVISVMTGMGVFATFSDTANGGDNSVTSGERPHAADLKIEMGLLTGANLTEVNCDADADGILWDKEDLTTPQFSVQGVQPNTSLGTAYVCLYNAGSSELSLGVGVVDLANLDTGCTGDEAASGDATCGLDATTQTPQSGELAGLLQVQTAQVSCADVSQVVYDGGTSPLIQVNPSLSDPNSTLLPNSYTCVRIAMTYPSVSELDAQIAQSDQVTWHFAFDGTAL